MSTLNFTAVMVGNRRDAAELPRKLRSILQYPCMFHIVPNNAEALEQSRLLWYDLILQHEDSTTDCSSYELFSQLKRADGCVPPVIFLRKNIQDVPSLISYGIQYRRVQLASNGEMPLLMLSSAIATLVGSGMWEKDAVEQKQLSTSLRTHPVDSTSTVTTLTTCSSCSSDNDHTSSCALSPSSFGELLREISCSTAASDTSASVILSLSGGQKRQRCAELELALSTSADSTITEQPAMKQLKRPQARYPRNFTAALSALTTSSAFTNKSNNNKPYPLALAPTLPVSTEEYYPQREPRAQIFHPIQPGVGLNDVQRSLSAQELQDRGMVPCVDRDHDEGDELCPAGAFTAINAKSCCVGAVDSAVADADDMELVLFSHSSCSCSYSSRSHCCCKHYECRNNECVFTEAKLEHTFRCNSDNSCYSDLSATPSRYGRASSCYPELEEDLCMFKLDL